MQSTPETYPIADFLKWHRERELVLNPHFQRGPVWTESAKTYLIDTILRGMPIPKILFRTRIDRETKQIVREVVDGQQRLRAIIAFANDQLRLGKRAKEYAGLRYSDLDDEDKDRFLAYKLTTEQLVNASDDDVLEIFARINSYTVPVNPPELRHAKYDSDFKWSVIETKTRIAEFWALGTLTERQRVRMLDASLVAEMYGILLKGVTDGGQPAINRLYEEFKSEFPQQQWVEEATLQTIDHVLGVLSHLKDEPIVGAPHVLMVFAATANAVVGIPPGQLEKELVDRAPDALSDLPRAREHLTVLNRVLSEDEAPRGWERFWNASKSSTQRIASRRDRFPYYRDALRPSVSWPS